MNRLPTLKPKEVIAALRKAGFSSPRQKGSHYYLVHPDGRRTSVPVHGKDLKRTTLFEILKQAGLSQDGFRKLLRPGSHSERGASAVGRFDSEGPGPLTPSETPRMGAIQPLP